METKFIRALLIGLIVAFVFHAYAQRYDGIRLDDNSFYRLNRLTGAVSLCVVAPGHPVCLAAEER